MCTHPRQIEWLDQIEPLKPREPTPIDTFNFGPRRSLTELRPRHLHLVEELANRETYDRNAVRDWMLANYNFLFGAIRYRKAAEVPSDSSRKLIIISRLLDTKPAAMNMPRKVPNLRESNDDNQGRGRVLFQIQVGAGRSSGRSGTRPCELGEATR